MSPDTIPWILCGTLCLLPFTIGTVTFFAFVSLSNRMPSLDVYRTEDEGGRKRVHLELVMLSREERKARRHPKEEE